MKNAKPKGKTPSLIGNTNGRPKKVLVEKKSKCARCDDALYAGKYCIGIPTQSGGFTSTRRYCDECFRNILKQTSIDLEAAKGLVGAETPAEAAGAAT